LEGAYGNPFLRIKDSEKIIGSFIRHGTGLILLLPSLKHLGPPAARQAASQAFVTSVEALVQRLEPQKGEMKLPSWSLRFTWQHETQMREKLLDLETLEQQTSRDIADTSEQLRSEERLKLLFTVKGDVLVDAAIEAFRALGAKATRGDPGRDDIILTFDNQSAVVEVKGKKGSAAERDAAQLEKWVAGFKEAKDHDAKGILVINAFCEKPLDQRTDPPFPNQMLKYCEQRGHCLMTSTQLLGMVLTSRGREDKGAECLNKIFSTTGTLEDFVDWQGFLQIADLLSSVEAA